MILTITPNTGLDRIIFLENLALGKTIRAQDSAWGMGGKATDATMVLGELGEPAIATGFAAGETGQRMVRMLCSYPTNRCQFVWTEGETRTNYVLVDTAQKAQSTITVAGLRVTPIHIAELEAVIDEEMAHTSCVIMGGSLPQDAPPELYARLIQKAKARGLPTILDASGDALKAGASALPTILKPNRDELETLAGTTLRTDQEVLRAAQALVQKGVQMVVATVGQDGLWVVRPDTVLYAPPLPISPVNTAGAGDALVAGMATGIARGWPWSQGIRLGMAAAAAVCLTPGTAICHRDDIERLLPKVQLETKGAV